jgi:hypothetical protein
MDASPDKELASLIGSGAKKTNFKFKIDRKPTTSTLLYMTTDIDQK